MSSCGRKMFLMLWGMVVVVNHGVVQGFALPAVRNGPRHAVFTRLPASRREILQDSLLLLSSSALMLPSKAMAVTGAKDGYLPDLPPDAVRSYLQYRIPLQISADYYVYDLYDKILDMDEWGDVGQLFVQNNSRGGQGQPNRIERDFVNPMRIVRLSMPPDAADDLANAQLQFERAMQQMKKATAGIKRDLPIEVDSKVVMPLAKEGWENGRLALNSFFDILNDTTGLPNELTSIPSNPSQYKRSQRKYLELAKKTKLCQNRGGPALSQAWGTLMVSGYLQDSCGIPDLDQYFFQ